MNKFQANFETLLKEFPIEMTLDGTKVEPGTEALKKIFKFVRQGRDKDKNAVEELLNK